MPSPLDPTMTTTTSVPKEASKDAKDDAGGGGGDPWASLRRDLESKRGEVLSCEAHLERVALDIAKRVRSNETQKQLLQILIQSLGQVADRALDTFRDRQAAAEAVKNEMKQLEMRMNKKGVAKDIEEVTKLRQKLDQIWTQKDAAAMTSLHWIEKPEVELTNLLDKWSLLSSALKPEDLKLSASLQSGSRVEDRLWMTLKPRDDVAGGKFCKSHLADLEMQLSGGGLAEKRMRLCQLPSKELLWTEDGLQIKLTHEDLMGDVFVEVKYLGAHVCGSPQVMSVRMNQSFCMPGFPKEIMDLVEKDEQSCKPSDVEVEKEKDGDEPVEGNPTAFVTLNPDQTLADRPTRNEHDLDKSDLNSCGHEESKVYNTRLVKGSVAATNAIIAAPLPASPLPASKGKLIAIGANSPMLASIRDQGRKNPLQEHEGDEQFDPCTASTSAGNLAEQLKKASCMLALQGQHLDSGILDSDPAVDINSLQKNLSGEHQEQPEQENNPLAGNVCKSVSFSFPVHEPKNGRCKGSPAACKGHEEEEESCNDECNIETVLNPSDESKMVHTIALDDSVRDGPVPKNDLTLFKSGDCQECNADPCRSLEHYEKAVALGEVKEDFQNLTMFADRSNSGLAAPTSKGNNCSAWNESVAVEPAFDLANEKYSFKLNGKIKLGENSGPNGVARHPNKMKDITFVADAMRHKVYRIMGAHRVDFAPYIDFKTPRSVICFKHNMDVRVMVLDMNALYLFTGDGSRYKTFLQGQVGMYRGLYFDSNFSRVLTTETVDDQASIVVISISDGTVVDNIPILNRGQPVGDAKNLLIRFVVSEKGYIYTSALGTGQVFKTSQSDRKTVALRRGEKDEASTFQFTSPTGLALDPAGNLLIASQKSNTVSLVAPGSGVCVRKIRLPQCNTVGGIVLEKRMLCVIDLKDKYIKKYCLVEDY